MVKIISIVANDLNLDLALNFVEESSKLKFNRGIYTSLDILNEAVFTLTNLTERFIEKQIEYVSSKGIRFTGDLTCEYNEGLEKYVLLADEVIIDFELVSTICEDYFETSTGSKITLI